jgi:hypothetical protein
MSNDTIDLLKVLVVTFLVMALATAVLFFLGEAFQTYGGSLPLIGDLPAYNPPAAVPVLVDTRWLVVVGAAFLVASGLVLLAWSGTLDMAMLVFAKAVTVLISALFGIFAGTWLFMRVSEGTELSLASLNRLGIALVVFFVFSTVLRTPNLRASGALRFFIAAVLIVLGPILLASF